MFVAAVLMPVADLIVSAADKTPKDEDVKAGWTALVVFVLLIAAVVVLAFSFTKQLRKAQAAKDAGVYGEDDETESDAEQADEPENHSAS
jgi:flagellar basal body-associated protein FliL